MTTPAATSPPTTSAHATSHPLTTPTRHLTTPDDPYTPPHHLGRQPDATSQATTAEWSPLPSSRDVGTEIDAWE